MEIQKARQEKSAVTPMTIRSREARRQDFCQMAASARVQGRRTPNQGLRPGCQKTISNPTAQQRPVTRYCQ